MAKKKHKGRKPTRPPQTTPATLTLPPVIQKYPLLWVAVVLFVLLLILYHENMIFGKPFLGGDTLKATMCYRPFINDALERGIYPLWNPYIFSGMPSFASLSSAPWVNVIDSLLNHTIQFFSDNDFIRIFLNYILFGWLMFILLRRFKITPGVALFGALGMVLMPQFVAFGVHGHNTKIITVALIPLILYLVDQLLERRNLLFMALTALTLGFQLFRAHVQVCFYTYLLLAFYFIGYAIIHYKEHKTYRPILKSAGLLVCSGILAFGLASIMYLSIYEYSHYSIRGGGTEGGLDYNYATGWSFSPIEMLTFFVPGFVGFGGQSYWGPMGFTDYPLYMSLIALYLAGFAFLLNRNLKVWIFGIVALFSLLVSFGDHFPLLYYPMFKWLPFFNKFRIPSMIHILLNISVIILAVIGLNALLKLGQSNIARADNSQIKKIQIYSYIFGGFCLLLGLYLLLGKQSYLELAAASDTIKKYTSQGYPLKQLNQYILEPAYQLAQRDGLKMLLLFGASFGLIWLYLKKKIGEIGLVGLLSLLIVIDLWLVDAKIINDKFEQNQRARLDDPAEYFEETEIVKYLKQQQEREIFRIYPADTQDHNWYMYHLIQSVYGYNPAKLKIYQEMLEAFQLNAKMLAMLNTKYVTSNESALPGFHLVPGFENSRPKLFESDFYLPRAFFVHQDTVIRATSAPSNEAEQPDRVLKFMQSRQFMPHAMAVLEEAPPFPIEPSAENAVKIDSYDIHNITLTAQVAKPAHLVLSEIFYSAGWKAYVDGEETRIYKTNSILRSIFLKPGRHQIEFIFDPLMFRLGLWLSIGTFILLLLIIGASLYRQKKA